MGGGRTNRQERSVIEDRDLNARLENWARVYRDRPNRRSQPSVIVRLIALYGEPDPKAYWRTAEMPDEPRPPKDETDAALIERALCSPLFPERYRLIICGLYLYPKVPVCRIRRKLGLGYKAFRDRRRRAKVTLQNILTFYEKDIKYTHQ